MLTQLLSFLKQKRDYLIFIEEGKDLTDCTKNVHY